MERELWYVAYGSNMAQARFRCYIEGGRPVGARRTLPGCRDRTFPREWRAVRLPGAVYFALESLTWGGGMAFYDPAASGTVTARAWRITHEQFEDLVHQEMHRDRAAEVRAIDLAALVPGARVALGDGRYETLVHVGELDALPMITFTCPWGRDDVVHVPPSSAYRAMIDAGLEEIQSTSAE